MGKMERGRRQAVGKGVLKQRLLYRNLLPGHIAPALVQWMTDIRCISLLLSSYF